MTAGGRLVDRRPCARNSPASGLHRMKLDEVRQRVLVDRSGVCRALTQRLAVRLADASHVLRGDRRERDELDAVDLDLTQANPVAAALLDLWPLPQPDGERDVSGQDVVVQLAAELHTGDASRWSAASRVVAPRDQPHPSRFSNPSAFAGA